jgi:hypothetical protein
MGAEAGALGHGGIRAVARAAGVREATVSLGADELDSGAEPRGRARRPGGGRKRAADLDPGLRPALLALVEPDERGDPVSPLRWTTKPARNLAAELTRQGHRVGADTVGDLLREGGFSLQGNAKTIEGRQHPDRDAQFHYINEQARACQGTADPVISVDTKKKELAGEFKNAGRQWRPQGQPVAGIGCRWLSAPTLQESPAGRRWRRQWVFLRRHRQAVGASGRNISGGPGRLVRRIELIGDRAVNFDPAITGEKHYGCEQRHSQHYQRDNGKAVGIVEFQQRHENRGNRSKKVSIHGVP